MNDVMLFTDAVYNIMDWMHEQNMDTMDLMGITLNFKNPQAATRAKISLKKNLNAAGLYPIFEPDKLHQLRLLNIDINFEVQK